MAIQLPKYNRQVGVASGAGAQQMVDPNAALAPIRAMGRAIDVTTNIGIDFAQRLQKHKVEGEVAGYKNDAKALDDRVKLAKQQARMEGVTDDEIMEKAVVPTLESFYQEQRDKGMTKKATEYMEADFGSRTEAIYAAEQSEILQGAIIKSNLQKVELASNMMAEGDMDSANAIFKELEATSKPGQPQQWKSGALYGLYNNDILIAERTLAESDDPDKDAKYFAELERIRGESESSGMNVNHKRTITAQTLSKGNNYMTRRTKTAQKLVKDTKKLLADSDSSASDFDELTKNGPTGMSESLQRTIYDEMKGLAPTDTDAEKALEILVKRSKGEISYHKAFKELEGLGQYGQAAIWYTADIMDDDVRANGEVPAFQGFFGAQEKYPVDGTTGDYIDNLSSFIKYSDSPGAFFKSKINRYMDWRERNADATEEEYEIWRNSEFKTVIDGFVAKQVAPQQKRTIIGEKLDKNGKRIAVQYDDGTVEEM